MNPVAARRSALYRLEAFGLQNEWNLLGLANGTLSGFCLRCNGGGIEIRRPCWCAEAYPKGRPNYLCAEPCASEDGCRHCRRRCGLCRGRRFAPAPVFAEDFGDRESLAWARSMFDVDLAKGRRIDMEAGALG